MFTKTPPTPHHTDTAQMRRSALGMASALFIFDQFSKYLITQYFFVGDSVMLLPFLRLTFVYNSGIAFGLFADITWGNMLFGLLSFCVGILLFFFLWKNHVVNAWERYGYACFLAGAFGNGIDRVIYGAVVDFIHFSYGNWYFPIFNAADITLNIGVFLLLISVKQSYKKIKKN